MPRAALGALLGCCIGSYTPSARVPDPAGSPRSVLRIVSTRGYPRGCTIQMSEHHALGPSLSELRYDITALLLISVAHAARTRCPRCHLKRIRRVATITARTRPKRRNKATADSARRVRSDGQRMRAPALRRARG